MGHAARLTDNEDLTFYPDHDHMGESTLQRLMTELLRPLLARFLGEQGQRCFVGADQFIYYIKGNPRAVVAPDVYVMPDADPDAAPRCWKTWETPARPSFALEIMSEVDDLKDVAHAPQRHDELGTKELIVFDPYVDVASGRTRFRVHRRDAYGNLVVVEATNRDRVESAVLGGFLRAVGEGAALRLRLAVGPSGDEIVPTDNERAALETQRAALEAQRAALEAQRAALADIEIQRLRAELDALRRR